MTTLYLEKKALSNTNMTEHAASFVLKRWEFTEPGVVLAEQQDDPRWQKMQRLLHRNGWDGAAPLSYSQLQALAAWDVNLRLVVFSEKGHAAASAPQPDTRAKPQFRQNKEKPAKSTVQRNSTPVRLWHPWPQPSKALVAKATALLTLVQEELVQDARESIATRWDHKRLAVRQEIGQLDPARHWEKLGLPRLLLALDFSGSIGGFVWEIAALGAALATTFPWLVLAAAPNATLDALTRLEEKQVIVDGGWESFPQSVMSVRTGLEAWAALRRQWPVRAAIYVGDWEADNMASAFSGRFGVLSVFQGSFGPPQRSQHAYGVYSPWPQITRCNSAEDFLVGLKMILPEILRNTSEKS